MDIHRPASVGHGILKLSVAEDIVFIQDIIPYQTSAFSGTRQHSDPFQIVIFCAMVATVFQMIPYSVNAGYQFIPDLLILVNDVICLTRKFDPPVSVVYRRSTEGCHSYICLVHLSLDLCSMYCGVGSVFQFFFRKGSGKIRLFECHRMSSVHRFE